MDNHFNPSVTIDGQTIKKPKNMSNEAWHEFIKWNHMMDDRLKAHVRKAEQDLDNQLKNIKL